jgi:hypothetical protein
LFGLLLILIGGLGIFFGDAMATHPPLPERIKRIDPAFDGRFPPVESGDWPTQAKQLAVPMAPMDSAAFTRLAASPRVAATKVTRRSGQTVQVQYAADLIHSVPAELRAAAGNSWNAASIVFALVLSRDAEVRARQLSQLSSFNSNLAAQVARYADALANQDTRARLLLLNLSLPALRTISREQWQRLRGVLEQMVCCDAQIDLFEFVVKRVIEQNIDAHFAPKKAAVIQFYSFASVARDCAVLLSAMAHVGNPDGAEVERTFAEGSARLPLDQPLPLVPASHCGVQQIDAALSRLAQSVPHIKKTVLEACAHTIACDGYVKAEEAELLRAIAESLGCPIPPFVAGV